MMWSVSLGLNNAVGSLKQSRFVFCSLSTKLPCFSKNISQWKVFSILFVKATTAKKIFFLQEKHYPIKMTRG